LRYGEKSGTPRKRAVNTVLGEMPQFAGDLKSRGRQLRKLQIKKKVSTKTERGSMPSESFFFRRIYVRPGREGVGKQNPLSERKNYHSPLDGSLEDLEYRCVIERKPVAYQAP